MSIYCSTAEARRWEVLSDCFWGPLCWWAQPGSFAALGVQGSSQALALHTRSAVKASDHPQTIPPTAPTYPRPCCLANYEYSLAMNVILSDMQLSIQILSAVLFVFEESDHFLIFHQILSQITTSSDFVWATSSIVILLRHIMRHTKNWILSLQKNSIDHKNVCKV